MEVASPQHQQLEKVENEEYVSTANENEMPVKEINVGNTKSVVDFQQQQQNPNPAKRKETEEHHTLSSVLRHMRSGLFPSSSNRPEAQNPEAMLHGSCTTYSHADYSPASSPTGALDICRICHCEGDNEAPLIAPCYCSGSLRFVHQACLQQWIKSSDTKSCELCKFEFIMQTKIKPFRKWEKLDMSTMERRKVLCSVTFHLVAITCVVWSLYVLIDRTAEEIRDGVLQWPLWTKLIVVAIGFTGGLVFMYVQCKMYLQLCRRWRAFNRVIYVQNVPLKAPAAHNGATVIVTTQVSAITPSIPPLSVAIPMSCISSEDVGKECSEISLTAPIPDIVSEAELKMASVTSLPSSKEINDDCTTTTLPVQNLSVSTPDPAT